MWNTREDNIPASSYLRDRNMCSIPGAESAKGTKGSFAPILAVAFGELYYVG